MTLLLNQPANGNARNERLNLYSFSYLEFLLGINRAELRFMARRAGAYYHPFCQEPKARPFARKPLPTKTRLIDNPRQELKRLQRRINERLLRPLLLPEHLLGGVAGKSVRDNVLLHIGAPCIVTIDIKKFFPSITPLQVYRVWRHRLNCAPRVAAILTRLTTFRGYLPQGAPTSTALANLVLSGTDCGIRAACEAAAIRYSSWVDDLAFSGSRAREIVPTVIAALLDAGFRVSHRKIRIMGPRNRKTINKLVLSKSAAVDRQYLSSVRAGIYNLQVGRVPGSVQVKYIRSLEGSINYIGLFQPAKAAKLRLQLMAAQLSQIRNHGNAVPA